MRSSKLIALAAALAVVACSGKDGAPGANGTNGINGTNGTNGTNGVDGVNGTNGTNGTSGDAAAYGTLTGVVSDTYGNKVAGAKVSASVGQDTVSATSDANGAYTLSLAPSARPVTFTASGYYAYAQSVEVAPGKSLALNVTLNPTGPAAVTAVRTDTVSPVVPGLQVSLRARLVTFDPALAGAPVTYAWTRLSGPPATFDDAASATPKATLASGLEFKKYAVELAAPKYKVNPDEPPVAVDRYQVVPFSYEQALTYAPATKFRVTATVGGRSYTADVTVNATIPVVPTTGLANVPVGSPVVLQGQFPFKNVDGTYVFTMRNSWAWTVMGPDGAVALNDADQAYPDFMPTKAGLYQVSEGGTPRFTIYADTYNGMMSAAGTPTAYCTGCHRAGGSAPDLISPWLVGAVG